MPSSNLWQTSCAEPFAAADLTASCTADVLIIGGGFTGCSAALELARRGAQVCLLEARDIGYGGSGRNVGLVNAGLWLPPEKIVAALGRVAAERLIKALGAGPQAVFDIIERDGIRCESTHCGTLHLADTSFGCAELQMRFDQGVAYGAPFELLDAQACAARVGTDRYGMAIFDPRAGTVQPLAYCRGLARAAAEAGARIYARSPAVSLERRDNHWCARTPRGSVTATAVLVATNAYTEPDGPGVAPAYVTVYYHQAATAPMPADIRKTILPGGEGCWDAAKVMSSLRTDRAGRLIIGSMGNLDGQYGGSHRRWLRRLMADLFPALADTPFEHEWCGQIAMTADHVPRILAFGPNALAIFGYSGRGIAPGTVFGRAAAHWFDSGDAAALPLTPVDVHKEWLPGLRAHLFESGAGVVHATLSPEMRRRTSL